MEALILSCGTGGGHHSAARAVADELKRRGHTAVFLDPFTLAGRKTAALVGNSYIRVVQNSPRLFGFAYSLGEHYRRLPVTSPVYQVNSLLAGHLKRYLEENHFDVIFMTHMYPAHVLTALRKKGTALPPTIQIATDYTCIPFTEETECDAYIIPSDKLKAVFTARGLPGEKLYPLGIPVSRSFSQKEDRQAACKRLGLDPDKRYVLAAGGSMGGGKVKKIIQTLADEIAGRKDTKLIVICGSNKRMYDELVRKALPGVKVIGFTSDMAEYMKAADLFVTKPGGLSSTEAAVCGIPMIHVAPIPGCETYNARFFSGCGMSRFCHTSKRELAEALKILDSKTECDTMVRNQRKIIRPDSAGRISDFAEKMAAAAASVTVNVLRSVSI